MDDFPSEYKEEKPEEEEKPKKGLFGKALKPASDEKKEQKEQKQPKPKSPESGLKILFIVIIVLLVLQLGVSGFQLYRNLAAEARDNTRQALINKSVATYTANLDALTSKMLTDYKTNVYGNTAVDTTSKQQVMGLEFNFNALMLLVKQNSRLMELIATSN